MDKFFLALVLFFVAAFTFGSCNDSGKGEVPPPSPTKQILTASTGAGIKSRVAIEDNGSAGLKILWAEGDAFSLFDTDANTLIGTFVLVDGVGSTEGKFEQEVVAPLRPGGNYKAVYPASAASTPDSATASFTMTADFTYNQNKETVFTFISDHAVLTIDIEAPSDYNATTDGLPMKLLVTNSNDPFQVIEVEIKATTWSTSTVVQVPTPPEAAKQRELGFTVITDKGRVFTTSVNTSDPYAVATRYELALTGEHTLDRIEACFMADLNRENIPKSDTWIILDRTVRSEVDFVNLHRVMKVVSAEGKRQISLVFPYLERLPKRALANQENELDCMKSVCLERATFVGFHAFTNCKGMTHVDLPMVETVDGFAFRICDGLTTVRLPRARTISDAAISFCLNLREVDLPMAETLGNNVFNSCKKLIKISMPNLRATGESIFINCSGLSELTLATDSVIEQMGTTKKMIFSGCPLGNITLTIGRSNGSTVNGTVWTVPANGGECSYEGFKQIILVPTS